MLRHRSAPWIAFFVLMGLASTTPYFVDKEKWVRGGGDIAIVVFGVCVLALVWWERALKRP